MRICLCLFWVPYYFLFPNRPRMMAPELERMTELRAFLAARLAMVWALEVFPPVAALMMLVDSAPITAEAAVVAACWAIFFFLAASRSAAFWAARASFSAALMAAAST